MNKEVQIIDVGTIWLQISSNGNKINNLFSKRAVKLSFIVTLISPLKMFLISTSYDVMIVQIDLMKIQFCTEIETKCSHLAHNQDSSLLN